MDDDDGSSSNNHPLPSHFVSPFFQISMGVSCAFVRGKGLGGFLPSVSQPQNIRVKGRLEKCWNC